MTQLDKAVNEISVWEDFLDELMTAVNATFAKTKRAVKDDLDRYQAVLVDLRAREDRTYDHFASGVIDLETYNRQGKRLQDESTLNAHLMQEAQLRINDVSLC